MTLPKGPNLAGIASVDSPSNNGTCLYPALPLTTGPYPAVGIYVNKAPLLFYHNACVPDVIVGVPNNPLIPCLIPVTPRKIITKTNTTVFFNKFNPAVIPGDVTEALSTERPLVGPVQHPNLFIASKAKKKKG